MRHFYPRRSFPPPPQKTSFSFSTCHCCTVHRQLNRPQARQRNTLTKYYSIINKYYNLIFDKNENHADNGRGREGSLSHGVRPLPFYNHADISTRCAPVFPRQALYGRRRKKVYRSCVVEIMSPMPRTLRFCTRRGQHKGTRIIETTFVFRNFLWGK